MKNNLKTLLSLMALIVISNIPLNAQEYEYVPFPTKNAIWSEYYFPGGEDEDGNYERFALNGEDTIINDIVYKKLYLFYDTVFNVNTATYFGGIREDSNKKVYFKCEQILHELKPMTDLNGFDEMILYDFSLNIGDTINSSKDTLNYNWMYDDTLVIRNIDMVNIGGKLRKQFQFENYFWVNWIEGIGNTDGLLFASGDLPFNGLSGSLICFKQNNEVLYLNGNECMPLITGIQSNNSEQQSFSIYPNPATQNINIIFSTTVSGKFNVYSANGKLVYSTQLTKVNETGLLLPCLNSGLYYATLTTSSSRFYSKLIIN